MSPIVLGLDTSGQWCSAALLREDALHVRRAEVGNSHSEHLIGMIDAVLADAAVAIAECDVIAFGAGPGSFTGLRVACAAAQGLAFGADLPVAAIGTLDAIAQSIVVMTEAGPPTTVLVAQDARMGEVYWSLFDVHQGELRRSAGPHLSAPDRLHDAIERGGRSLPIAAGCGNAWSVHGDRMDGLVMRVVARPSADAADIAALGARAWREGTLISAEHASPVYVRNDVALTIQQRMERKNATTNVVA